MGRSKPRSRRTAIVLLASAGGGILAMLAAAGEDVKNSYEALERTGRVAAALVLCINE